VTSRTLKSSSDHDASSDLLRRCRHAAASVGSQIYIYGGLRGGNWQWISCCVPLVSFYLVHLGKSVLNRSISLMF
jgi:hypothetical protein